MSGKIIISMGEQVEKGKLQKVYLADFSNCI